MAERKYEPDKVYLQGPNGVIWPYDALLAGQDGFKPVVPNKTTGSEVEPMQASENVGTVAKNEAAKLASTNKSETPKPQQPQQNTSKAEVGKNAQ